MKTGYKQGRNQMPAFSVVGRSALAQPSSKSLHEHSSVEIPLWNTVVHCSCFVFQPLRVGNMLPWVLCSIVDSELADLDHRFRVMLLR
jgi:hypothetical protein